MLLQEIANKEENSEPSSFTCIYRKTRWPPTGAKHGSDICGNGFIASCRLNCLSWQQLETLEAEMLSRLTRSTCFSGHYSPGLCSASTSSVLPSIHLFVHAIVAKLLCAEEMRDEFLPTGCSLHEFIRFLIFLNCHLLNCSAAALARVQITTFTAQSRLNSECTCKPSVRHSWALRPAVDGRSKKRCTFHLMHLFNDSAGWINDGWNCQLTYLAWKQSSWDGGLYSDTFFSVEIRYGAKKEILFVW